MFPFRFLAAYQAVPSLRWGHALEQALNASLASVPRLAGRTLILVDRSGSMFDRPSAKSGLNRADTAAVFGTALALRAEQADLVEFGTGSAVVPFRPAEPVLKVVRRFGSLGGTSTAAAVKAHFRRGRHARVVIVTDEQAMGRSAWRTPSPATCRCTRGTWPVTATGTARREPGTGTRSAA